MLKIHDVRLPGAKVEVKVVLPSLLGVGSLRGCSWSRLGNCREGVQEIAKRTQQKTDPATSKRVHGFSRVNVAMKLGSQVSPPSPENASSKWYEVGVMSDH